jgi:outer membrane protein
MLELKEMDKIKLSMPDVVQQMTVAADKVLAEAFDNRSDAIAFVRRLAGSTKRCR